LAGQASTSAVKVVVALKKTKLKKREGRKK
jgi:hypothetical protein